MRAPSGWQRSAFLTGAEGERWGSVTAVRKALGDDSKSYPILAILLSLTVGGLAGCYYGNRPLTYPSPAPTQGERIVYPPVDPRGLGLSGFDQLCGERWIPAASGPTRSAVAFDSDGLQLCFMSPMVVGHTREFSCMATAFDHVASRGNLRFRVFVLGSNLDLSHASATLEVGGSVQCGGGI